MVARRACARRISAGQGMTARTLKLRARPAQIGPGKAYLSTLVGVRAMIEATRVAASAESGPPLPWRKRLDLHRQSALVALMSRF